MHSYRPKELNAQLIWNSMIVVMWGDADVTDEMFF